MPMAQGALMRTLRAALSTLALAATFVGFAVQAQVQPPPKRPQFVYVLKVTPGFHDASKWTQRENDAVARQFMESDPAVIPLCQRA
jgi:hypothetical protein